MVQGKISIAAEVLHNLPSLDVGGMLNDLLIASLSPLGVVQILSFQLWSTLKLHAKYQIWDSLSAWERG